MTLDLVKSQLRHENKIKSASSWFMIIALLSTINSFVAGMGGSLNFIFGLGTSQLIDSFSLMDNTPYSTGGMILNFIVIGLFYMIGMYATMKSKIAFIIGMILYSFDAILLIVFEDYLAFAFHIFALVSIWKGFQTIDKLEQINLEIIKTENETSDAIGLTEE